MPKLIKLFKLSFIAAVFTVMAMPALAAQVAPPMPPNVNPHPPVTNADKTRVAFAEKVVEALLSQPKLYVSPDSTTAAWSNNDKPNLNIKPACLNDPVCLKQNKELAVYLGSFVKTYGHLRSHVHTHIIPWSFNKFMQNSTPKPTPEPSPGATHKKSEAGFAMKSLAGDEAMVEMAAPDLANDEYMFHVYTLFELNSDWHHMDIIVSEDKDGNLVFRRLFIIPMPRYSHSLPDGVVC